MNREDRSRLEEFRQLRKEVWGSKEYLLVGIDVAKDKHYAFFGTATGKMVLRRLVFENSLEGLRRLLAQVEAMKVQAGLRKFFGGIERVFARGHRCGQRPAPCFFWHGHREDGFPATGL